MNTFDVPIAFVVFNRPTPTAKSFEAIRSIRPSTLFLIGDAHRPDRVGEARLVEQCRELVENVDWPCQITRIYAKKNMGCGQRISTGISKAFETVDRLIILEDDCLAGPSFFSYCDELLDRFQEDQRVMCLSGNNFQAGIRRGDASYYFSKYPHCWGWATWRRAWKHFDLRIAQWPAFREQQGLLAMADRPREVEYWSKLMDQVHAGQSQSWAFPWTLACWMQHAMTVLPQVNLVSNIGFGDDATHTRRRTSVANLPVHSLGDITHATWIARNVEADIYTDDHLFSGTVRRGPLKRIENAIRRLRKG